jgi:hypothetical protein
MSDSKPGIGHNRLLNIPSTQAIIEFLQAETAELAQAAQENIICADERSEVVDDESAARAVQLEATMIEIFQDLDKLRLDIKRPLADATKTIDAHFHQITHPLVGPEPAKKREGAAGDIHARIDAFDQRRRAAIDAERIRLAEEARRQSEAAEKAEADRLAALETAYSTHDPVAQAAAFKQAAERGEAAQKLADESAKASVAAAAQVARPIDSGVGPKATRRADWQPQITDLSVAVANCLAIPQWRAQIKLVVLRAYRTMVRNGQRDMTVGGRTIPGLPGAIIVDHAKLTLRRK